MSGDWKSAAEWAAVGLAGFPATRQGVEWLIKSDAWRDLGPTKSRKRSGKGGGWEYHCTCLPDAAQADWAKRQRVVQANAVAAVQTAEVAVRVASTPEAVSARRRQIMVARAAIVLEVERRAFVQGSASKAIAALLADASAQILPVGLMAQFALAADKKHGAIPSRSRIFAWRQAYQDGGVMALLPEQRAQETKQCIPDWLGGFLRHYGKPSKPTIEQALVNYRDSLANVASAPSYDQVRRALKSLQGTNRFLDKFKGREGPLALKARLGFVRRTTDGMDPTTVYTADGKTFDAYVAHPIHGRPFRPEITTVVDVVTRMVVGWSVGLAENTIGVADALRHACVSHGICAILYTDNGAGFKNELIDHDTMGMCARLGITPSHSLPYNSQARGIIERVNGTIWNRLSKEFPTYQGADVDREAHQKRFRAIVKDVKETGASPLLPTWNVFLEQVALAVQAYNTAPHSSLTLKSPVTGRAVKVSPKDYWASFVANGFEPVPLTSDEADDLFRPHFKRISERGEVRWNNNHYFHADLQPFDGMEVLVGIDIHDAGRVWVRRIDMVGGAQLPGALICVADFWGNKARYFPHSYVADKVEKRGKNRLQRLGVRTEEVQDEMRGAMLIDAKTAPMPDFLQRPPEPVLTATMLPVEQSNVVEISDARRPLHAHPDVDLALESLADPSSLTPGRVRLLTELIGHRAGEEFLRISGVDLAALRNLLWSAA